MKTFLLVLTLSLTFLNVFTERTKEKIYYEIKAGGRSACFRRLNGTHQIGCSSEPKGNVGVVHYINESSDLDWLINTASHKPYAVLLNGRDFNMSTVSMLKSSGKVNGIMVIQIPELEDKYPLPSEFSPDKSCPNDRYGLYKGNKEYESCSLVTWNPVGDGMMFEDLGFPIFLLTDKKDTEFIIEKCYKKFNAPKADGTLPDYPLCAVQLKDRMDGAKDSETCIRRTRHQMNLNPDRYCDPMGDENVYATVKALNNTETRDNKSVIVVAARMDSFSMFEDQYPSADNHVSGIVALLAISEAIGKVKDRIQNSMSAKDIMFTFFQGEAFDYIGSGRMVYDMENNSFPINLKNKEHLQQINLTHISHLVEVNQLAHRDDGKVWIHTDPVSRPNLTEVDKMVASLKEFGQSLVDEVDQSQPLPPASVQSFLKEKREIPAVVITDHRKEYTNKFYNSRLDLAATIKADCVDKTACYDTVSEQARNLSEVATVIAKFLYKLSTGSNDTDDVQVNATTVDHLLFCFLVSPKCELFEESLPKDKADVLAEKPYPFYVGVNSQTNNFTSLTQQMLLRYLGDEVNESYCKIKDDNKDPPRNGLYHYSWMQRPAYENGTRDIYCMRGTANFSPAVSIAFDLNDYDYKSGVFSTWTESSWAYDAMQMRVFLIPSKKFETTTLSVGVILTILSMAIVYWINSRVDILFAPDRRYREYDSDLHT